GQRSRRLRRHRTHAGNVQVQRSEEAGGGEALMSEYLSPRVATLLVDVSYLLTAFLFIMGLKRMSSPVTARSGVIWAGWGMLVATLVTFLAPQITGTALEQGTWLNLWLMIGAILVGGVLAWWTG